MKKFNRAVHVGMLVFFISILCHAEAQEATMNSTLQTIFSRKSVRSYTGAAVPEEKLMMLVKAGMAAPTAVDRRPWDFIVITDKIVLHNLADVLPYAKMVENAAAAIVVTGDLNRQFGGPDSLFWIMDCSAATENILLAAESMGLGAVWTAVYPDEDRVNAVRALLKIPDHVVPLNLIPIGVPTGQDVPKDKFNQEQIHRNRW